MKYSWEFKLTLIQRAEDGESLQSVSIDNAIEESLLYKWFKIYQIIEINR
ncbi:MAG: hypothetical protein PUG55_04485 [Bacillales bacterium]|nr:hypothetical protein [Bacillales bacterium]MDY6003424.1 hypothetical protein [Bacilli bacterium]